MNCSKHCEINFLFLELNLLFQVTDNARYYDLFSVTRYAIILERKFLSMEQAGLGRIDNFVNPFVDQQLEKCLKNT